MLLILFLMGRRPELLVPDDIDPNDYEVKLYIQKKEIYQYHKKQYSIKIFSEETSKLQ